MRQIRYIWLLNTPGYFLMGHNEYQELQNNRRLFKSNWG